MAIHLIHIEGIDGSGKTTLRHALGQLPPPEGYQWWLTSEPRREPDYMPTSGIAQALYYNFDRRWHLEGLASLPHNHIILCDRGPLSTLAYQGGGMFVDTYTLKQLHTITMSGLEAKFRVAHLILRVPFDVALGRVQSRGYEKVDKDTETTMALAWNVYEGRPQGETFWGTEYPIPSTSQKGIVEDAYKFIERFCKGGK